MESNDKRKVSLLFRVSFGKRAHKELGVCRLCFQNIKKGQAFRIIEEEYGEMRQYLVHSICLNKNAEGEEMGKSLWRTIKCKTCGFKYESHPDVLDEKKLDGDCIGCFRKKEGVNL